MDEDTTPHYTTPPAGRPRVAQGQPSATVVLLSVLVMGACVLGYQNWNLAQRMDRLERTEATRAATVTALLASRGAPAASLPTPHSPPMGATLGAETPSPLPMDGAEPVPPLAGTVANPPDVPDRLAAEVVYVVASDSTFHREGCRYLAQGGMRISRGEAAARGYRPCTACQGSALREGQGQ